MLEHHGVNVCQQPPLLFGKMAAKLFSSQANSKPSKVSEYLSIYHLSIMTIFPEQGHWRTASHGPTLLHFLEHTAQGSQMVLSDWFLTEALICHLRWVLLPPEVQLLGDFLCDRRCSQEGEEDISAMSWYKHVLPQLRHRWPSHWQWYLCPTSFAETHML